FQAEYGIRAFHVTGVQTCALPILRFDFSHFQPVTPAELAEIERRVNTEVRANHAADIRHMDMQEALDFGAMALFGEKYGDRVRRSEEHTSELQSRENLVCRLLLEK